MGDVVTQGGQCPDRDEISVDLLLLIQRYGAMTQQVQKGLPLADEIEAPGEEHDRADIGAGDDGHYVLHEHLVAGEPLDDAPEQQEMLLGETVTINP